MKKNTVFVVHALDSGDRVEFPKIAATAAAAATVASELLERLARFAEKRSEHSRAFFTVEIREVDVREE